MQSHESEFQPFQNLEAIVASTSRQLLSPSHREGEKVGLGVRLA